MSKIIKSSLYYAAANMIPQAVAFLFLPIYSAYMSPSDFGILSAMETLTYMFAAVACLSIDQAAKRFYFDTNELARQKLILSTLFTSTIIFSFAFVLFAFLAKPLLQLVFSSIDFYPYFVFCILTVSLNNLSLITTNYYQVSEQPQKYMYLKVLRLLSKVLITIVFVVVLLDGAKGQLKAELFSALLFLPVYILIAHRNFGWGFDYDILKSAVKFSWPFIPTLLVSWVLTFSDRVFIDIYVGLDELGIYSMSYKISMIVFVVSSSFVLAYTPIFYKLANESNQEASKEIIFRYGWYACLLFLFLVFIFLLFCKELVTLILDEKYLNTYPLIRVLLIGHFFSIITSITSGLYIMQAKLTKLNMIIALKVALLNLFLNYLLIPDFGIYGAAFGTTLSNIMLSSLMYRASKKGYFVSVPWLKVIAILTSIMIVVGFYHFYLELFYPISIFSKLILLSLCLLFLYQKRSLIFEAVNLGK